MKFSLATAAAALASLTLAAPVDTQEAAISRRFRLRTQVISGMASFGGQYISPYHTGAGENVAVLTKTVSDASIGYINGTTANFQYGTSGYLWLTLGAPEDLYAEWAPLTYDITSETGAQSTDAHSSSYSIGPSGFFTHTKSDSTGFNGWRICNWVHGVPELFYNLVEGGSNPSIPRSCATVYLVPEYV